jgi:hypothetical protein
MSRSSRSVSKELNAVREAESVSPEKEQLLRQTADMIAQALYEIGPTAELRVGAVTYRTLPDDFRLARSARIELLRGTRCVSSLGDDGTGVAGTRADRNMARFEDELPGLVEALLETQQVRALGESGISAQERQELVKSGQSLLGARIQKCVDLIPAGTTTRSANMPFEIIETQPGGEKRLAFGGSPGTAARYIASGEEVARDQLYRGGNILYSPISIRDDRLRIDVPAALAAFQAELADSLTFRSRFVLDANLNRLERARGVAGFGGRAAAIATAGESFAGLEFPSGLRRRRYTVRNTAGLALTQLDGRGSGLGSPSLGKLEARRVARSLQRAAGNQGRAIG